MFDCHYDLLTYIYINKNNLKKVKKYCDKIFKNGINGGIFNFFYMSQKEMENELGIQKEEIDLIKNLEEVNDLIKENNIIPKKIKYIKGVEGLDFLSKIEDIDKMYKLGIRTVNIVWNNDNKYGGGIKGNKNKGLTLLGTKLLRKIVEANIAVDLSHANKKTFYDIINLSNSLKENGKRPKIFASHSNCKNICNNARNLTNNQILKIKELNGIIGIVGVKPFCIEGGIFNGNKSRFENAYIKQIIYLKELLNGVDNIAVSTDDMSYYETNKNYYKNFNVFKQYKMQKRLKKLLLKNDFSKEEIEKVLFKNAERFFEIN